MSYIPNTSYTFLSIIIILKINLRTYIRTDLINMSKTLVADKF